MKVLLIGSSFSAVPLLVSLKAFGAVVTVVGSDKIEPCHQIGDQSIFEDYSDAQKLLEVCRSEEFDYIVPSCNDYAYLSSSLVANELGLPGYDSDEVTSTLHSKDKFREICTALQIPTPKSYGTISSTEDLLEKNIKGTALLKPVDSFSGKGIQLIDGAGLSVEQVSKALSESRSKKAIIEEFVQGSLHSHTSFIEEGKIVWHDFVDEFCETYAYQVSDSSYPSILSEKTKIAVNQAIKKLIEGLNLANGLLHTQFIANEESFWLIETMRRCPGDLYGFHFKLSFDFDYAKQYVAPFLGRKHQIKPLVDKKQFVTRQVVTAASETNFFSLAAEPAEHATIFVPLKNAGEALRAAPADKAGIVFSVKETVFQSRPKARIIAATN